MTLKTESTTIDGMEFQTTQFPAMASFNLLARLVKTLGPAISALTAANPETDLRDLAGPLAAGLQTLNADDASRLVLDVLSCTTALVQGPSGTKLVALNTQGNIDVVFSGRLMVMFKVLAHALKVNYEDFAGGSDPAAPQTQNPSES
jgi:hypothetical protein